MSLFSSPRTVHSRLLRLAWFVKHLAKKGVADTLLLSEGRYVNNCNNSRALMSWVFTGSSGLVSWSTDFEGELEILSELVIVVFSDFTVHLFCPPSNTEAISSIVAIWPGTSIFAVPELDVSTLTEMLSASLSRSKIGCVAVAAPSKVASEWPALGGRVTESVSKVVDVSSPLGRLVHGFLDATALGRLAQPDLFQGQLAAAFDAASNSAMESAVRAPSLEKLAGLLGNSSSSASTLFQLGRVRHVAVASDLEFNRPGAVTLSQGGGVGALAVSVAHPLAPLRVARSIAVETGRPGAAELGAAIQALRTHLVDAFRAAKEGSELPLPSRDEMRRELSERVPKSTINLALSADIKIEASDLSFNAVSRARGVVYVQASFAVPAPGGAEVTVTRGDTLAVFGARLLPLTSDFETPVSVFLGLEAERPRPTDGSISCCPAVLHSGQISFLEPETLTEVSAAVDGATLHVVPLYTRPFDVAAERVLPVHGGELSLFLTAPDALSSALSGATRSAPGSFGWLLRCHRHGTASKWVCPFYEQVRAHTAQQNGGKVPEIRVRRESVLSRPSLETVAALEAELLRSDAEWATKPMKTPEGVLPAQIIIFSSSRPRSLLCVSRFVDALATRYEAEGRALHVRALTAGEELQPRDLAHTSLCVVPFDPSCVPRLVEKYRRMGIPTFHVLVCPPPPQDSLLSIRPRVLDAPCAAPPHMLPVGASPTTTSCVVVTVSDGASNREASRLIRKSFPLAEPFVVAAPPELRLSAPAGDRADLFLPPVVSGLLDDLIALFRDTTRGLSVPTPLVVTREVYVETSAPLAVPAPAQGARFSMKSLSESLALPSTQPILRAALGRLAPGQLAVVPVAAAAPFLLEATRHGITLSEWSRHLPLPAPAVLGDGGSTEPIERAFSSIIKLLAGESASAVRKAMDKEPTTEQNLTWEVVKKHYSDEPLPEGWLTDGVKFFTMDGERSWERPDKEALIARYKLEVLGAE
eukprot:gnl/Chilomastix_cuspidata/3178.p1 GENE.gnl/Chilomastix_cuspidata/3178~~gnl/Chilomastix_cuspidata/3178.p1  ORF type:complete len:985 (-),score=341.73 gnl/Chilomastix_cuspidata/3178:20-2974(-)